MSSLHAEHAVGPRSLQGRVSVFMCAPPSADLDVLPEIKEILKSGAVPETRDLFPCGSIDDLRRTLVERRPAVLHYGGHGNTQLERDRVKWRTLAFTKSNGSTEVADPLDLVTMLTMQARHRTHPLLCVVLNACLTYELGYELHRHGVRFVVCWRTIVENSACTAFSSGFYHALMHGSSFPDAYAHGVMAMRLAKCSIGDPEAHMVVTEAGGTRAPVMYADGTPLRYENGAVLTFSKLVHGIPALLPEASVPPDHPVTKAINEAQEHALATRAIWAAAGATGVAAAAAQSRAINAAMLQARLRDFSSLVVRGGAGAGGGAGGGDVYSQAQVSHQQHPSPVPAPSPSPSLYGGSPSPAELSGEAGSDDTASAATTQFTGLQDSLYAGAGTLYHGGGGDAVVGAKAPARRDCGTPLTEGGATDFVGGSLCDSASVASDADAGSVGAPASWGGGGASSVEFLSHTPHSEGSPEPGARHLLPSASPDLPLDSVSVGAGGGGSSTGPGFSMAGLSQATGNPSPPGTVGAYPPLSLDELVRARTHGYLAAAATTAAATAAAAAAGPRGYAPAYAAMSISHNGVVVDVPLGALPAGPVVAAGGMPSQAPPALHFGVPLHPMTLEELPHASAAALEAGRFHPAAAERLPSAFHPLPAGRVAPSVGATVPLHHPAPLPAPAAGPGAAAVAAAEEGDDEEGGVWAHAAPEDDDESRGLGKGLGAGGEDCLGASEGGMDAGAAQHQPQQLTQQAPGLHLPADFYPSHHAYFQALYAANPVAATALVGALWAKKRAEDAVFVPVRQGSEGSVAAGGGGSPASFLASDDAGSDARGPSAPATAVSDPAASGCGASTTPRSLLNASVEDGASSDYNNASPAVILAARTRAVGAALLGPTVPPMLATALAAGTGGDAAAVSGPAGPSPGFSAAPSPAAADSPSPAPPAAPAPAPGPPRLFRPLRRPGSTRGGSFEGSLSGGSPSPTVSPSPSPVPSSQPTLLAPAGMSARLSWPSRGRAQVAAILPAAAPAGAAAGAAPGGAPTFRAGGGSSVGSEASFLDSQSSPVGWGSGGLPSVPPSSASRSSPQGSSDASSLPLLARTSVGGGSGASVTSEGAGSLASSSGGSGGGSVTGSGGAGGTPRTRRHLLVIGGRGGRDCSRLEAACIEGLLGPSAGGASALSRGSTKSAAKCTWRRGPSLFSAADFACAAAPEALYLFGGSAGYEPSALSLCYDVLGGTVKKLAPIPVPTSQAAAAYLSGLDVAVLAGGWRPVGSSLHNATLGMRRVDVYHPGVDAWLPWPDMLFERARHVVVASPSGGLVYALGGEEPSSGRTHASVEFYDPRTKAWQLIPALGAPRAAFGAAFDSVGRLYAVGGDAGDGRASRTVERLDMRAMSVRSGLQTTGSGALALGPGALPAPTSLGAADAVGSSPLTAARLAEVDPASFGGRAGPAWGWERLADMKERRRGHAVCSSVASNATAPLAAAYFDALGGVDGPADGGTLPGGAGSLAASPLAEEDAIFVSGGLTRGWHNRRDAEFYHVRTGSWHALPSMVADRGLHAMACYELPVA